MEKRRLEKRERRGRTGKLWPRVPGRNRSSKAWGVRHQEFKFLPPEDGYDLEKQSTAQQLHLRMDSNLTLPGGPFHNSLHVLECDLLTRPSS